MKLSIIITICANLRISAIQTSVGCVSYFDYYVYLHNEFKLESG